MAPTSIQMQGFILNSKNYESCSITMKAFLQIHECWDIWDWLCWTRSIWCRYYDECTEEPTWRMKEGEQCLILDLEPSWLLYFAKNYRWKSVEQAWDILKLAYQSNDKVKTVTLQTLRRECENLKMKDTENIDQFITRVMGVVNQLRASCEDLAEQKIVEKVLMRLLKKFAKVIIVLEESKDLC